jgi:hypothetical protein
MSAADDRSRGVAAEAVAAEARELAQGVATAGGEAVRAVIFFGSRRTGTPTDAHSGWDLFVAVSDYRPFYESLARSGAYRRSARLAAGINAVLAPNQIRIGVGERTAKCAVIRLATLQRETGPRRRDHFCAGRLFQPASIAWAADEASREAVLAALADARRVTLDWARPWLPGCFDAEEFCKTALRVSMGFEIRPEPAGRAERLWDAQRAEQVAAFEPVLAEWAAGGRLTAMAAGCYELAAPVGLGERLRLWAFFQRSRLRATLRWAKYVVTFDDWLDYIVRKAERHTGQRIELSPRERRWPLVFLWPRMLRYLADKDSRGRR